MPGSDERNRTVYPRDTLSSTPTYANSRFFNVSTRTSNEANTISSGNALMFEDEICDILNKAGELPFKKRSLDKTLKKLNPHQMSDLNMYIRKLLMMIESIALFYIPILWDNSVDLKSYCTLETDRQNIRFFYTKVMEMPPQIQNSHIEAKNFVNGQLSLHVEAIKGHHFPPEIEQVKQRLSGEDFEFWTKFVALTLLLEDCREAIHPGRRKYSLTSFNSPLNKLANSNSIMEEEKEFIMSSSRQESMNSTDIIGGVTSQDVNEAPDSTSKEKEIDMIRNEQLPSENFMISNTVLKYQPEPLPNNTGTSVQNPTQLNPNNIGTSDNELPKEIKIEVDEAVQISKINSPLEGPQYETSPVDNLKAKAKLSSRCKKTKGTLRKKIKKLKKTTKKLKFEEPIDSDEDFICRDITTDPEKDQTKQFYQKNLLKTANNMITKHYKKMPNLPDYIKESLGNDITEAQVSYVAKKLKTIEKDEIKNITQVRNILLDKEDKFNVWYAKQFTEFIRGTKFIKKVMNSKQMTDKRKYMIGRRILLRKIESPETFFSLV